MKNSMHINRNPNILRYQEKCQELHKKKIVEANPAVRPKAFSQTIDELERRNLAKMRAHEFSVSEKEAQIRKGNQKLLDKLIQISSGKFVFFL